MKWEYGSLGRWSLGPAQKFSADPGSSAGPPAFTATAAVSPGATGGRYFESVGGCGPPFLTGLLQGGELYPPQLHGGRTLREQKAVPTNCLVPLARRSRLLSSCWLQAPHRASKQQSADTVGQQLSRRVRMGLSEPRRRRRARLHALLQLCFCPLEVGDESYRQHPEHGHATNLDSG